MNRMDFTSHFGEAKFLDLSDDAKKQIGQELQSRGRGRVLSKGKRTTFAVKVGDKHYCLNQAQAEACLTAIGSSPSDISLRINRLEQRYREKQIAAAPIIAINADTYEAKVGHETYRLDGEELRKCLINQNVSSDQAEKRLEQLQLERRDRNARFSKKSPHIGTKIMSFFWASSSEKPQQNTDDIIDEFTLISSTKDLESKANQLNRLKSILPTLSLNMLLNFLKTNQDLFIDISDDKDKQVVVKLKDQLNEILEIKRFVKDLGKNKDLEDLFDDLTAKLPRNDSDEISQKKERAFEEFQSLAKIVVRLNKDEEDVSPVILDAIQDSPPQEREEVVILTSSLIKADAPPLHTAQIIRAINAVPQKEREDVVRHVSSLIEADVETEYIAKILIALGTVTQEEREDVLKHASILITADISALDAVRIFRAIEDIPPQEREDVLKHARSLITVDHDTNDQLKILDDLKRTDQSDREGYVELFKEASRIRGTIEDADNFIFKELARFPAAERKEAADLTLRLIKNDVSAYAYKRAQILMIIKELFTQQERAEAVNCSLRLIKDDMNVQNRIDILSDISYIPSDQRLDVTERVFQLSSDLTDEEGKIDLIQVIAAIPQDQRDSLISFLNPFLNMTRNSDQRARVLKAINAVPQEEREDVVRHVSSLIKAGVNAEYIAKILSALGSVKKEERGDVLKHALSLIKADMNVEDIVMIFRGIEAIPSQERKDVIKHALSLIAVNHGMNVQDQLLILADIATIPSDQRRDVTERVLQLSNDLIDEGGKIALIKVIAAIPQDQRETLISFLNPFLNITRNLDLRAKILKAIHELPPNQRTENQIRLLCRRAIDVAIYSAEYDEYKIRIPRADLEEIPTDILHNLSRLFNQRRSTLKLNVGFLSEIGSDMGGLSREFISELFAKIKDKMQFRQFENGLYRPELRFDMSSFTIQPLSEEDKKIYSELGQLMMYCLNASTELPIGMIFDQGVFTVLTRLNSSLLNGKFDELDFQNPGIFDQLFAIYVEMNRNFSKKEIEVMQKSLEPLTDATPEDGLRSTLFAVEGVDAIDELAIDPRGDIKIIKENYSTIQAALKDQIAQKMQQAFAPLFEIAKGMKNAPFQFPNSWTQVQQMTPAALSIKLQGAITKEVVIDHLSFEGIPDEKQAWMKNWIQNADEEKIKRFIFAMSGSSALGNKNLQIKKCLGGAITFHTCFNSVEIPIDTMKTEQDFVNFLEGSLDGAEYTVA